VQEQVTLPDSDLNYTVISSIFQALFLRTGQDCGFVPRETLALLSVSEGIGKRMGRACSDAGLTPERFFDFGPDGPRLLPAVPDPALRDLVTCMAAPDYPVPLSVVPTDELAVILEHFTATRLEVNGGCRVNKTGKSAVLYTGSVDIPPPMVVDIMVRATLRGIAQDVHRQREPSVLDPACGTGIFLLAALRFLAGNSTSAKRPDIPAIACRSIFGTDIDPESVSAARFVLVLACIDRIQQEDSRTIPADGLREIASCVAGNVRCANSLVAPDYFTGRPVHPFNAEERRRVNPFDWDAAFPAVLESGGFDAIISAPPPYRHFPVQAREAYFQTHYAVYAPSAGLYMYFIEKGISLLRPGGAMGVLVPKTFLRSRHAREFRRFLLTRQIHIIADTGRTRPVQGSDARICLLVLSNRTPDRPFIVAPVPAGERSFADIIAAAQGFQLDQRSLGDGGWRLEDTRAADILARIRKYTIPLDQYIMGEFIPGDHREEHNPFIVNSDTRDRLATKAWCRRFFVPLIRSADIRRYRPAGPSRFVIVVKNRKRLRTCRALEQYLEKLHSTDGTRDGNEKAGGPDGFTTEKTGTGQQPGRQIPRIIFGTIQHSPAFAFEPAGSYAISDSLIAIPSDDLVLLAILNSSLGRFMIKNTCPLTECGYDMSPGNLGKFPVIAPDFDRLYEKNLHARIIALVRQLLSLFDCLKNAGSAQEKQRVVQEIDTTDIHIDALVYELYGLTADDIAVVEGSKN